MTEYERSLPPHTQADLVHRKDEQGRDRYWHPSGRPDCGRLKKVRNRQIPNEACLAPPMGNGACKVHGGRAGGPMKHGRYARVLKTWLPAFERARKDKDLLDARSELAAMDVLIERLMVRVEEMDAPAWREKLSQAHEELQTAMRRKKQKEVSVALKTLGDLIEQGAGIDLIARDLMTYLDKRAARANKVDELAMRREEKVTVSELGAVFRSWLGVLEQGLDEAVYLGLVEKLRRVTAADGFPGMDEAPDLEGEGEEEGGVA